MMAHCAGNSDGRQTLFRQTLFRQSTVSTSLMDLPATLTHLIVQLLELTFTRLHTHYPALIITGPWCQCQPYSLGLPGIYSKIFPERLQHTFNTFVLPLIFGIGSASFQSILPI